MTGLTTHDIRTAIKNAAGSRPALFVPDKAFEVLAQRQIKLLREPSLHAAESVHNELIKIIGEVENRDLKRYWRLKEAVIDTSSNMLRKMLKETQKVINATIDLEHGYINVSHPDFIGLQLLLSKEENSKPLPDPNENKNQGFFSGLFGFGGSKPDKTRDNTHDTISEREQAQINIIRRLLDSYFTITKKSVQDRVTKIIMMSLVNNASENMQKTLTSKLYKGEGQEQSSTYSLLLEESPDIAMRRKICAEEIDALYKAKRVIQMSEISNDV
eukprot:TRINITY_DN7218_c0_g1_i2.p1 TRINITY_DN7218_c0_g1~~TRINITY_DN7218_c0_g1_i2.p1  ORF type:complete len:272 (+),score=54.17 TRINITY_DN7218_c0_g1_i2:225-1040(+)